MIFHQRYEAIICLKSAARILSLKNKFVYIFSLKDFVIVKMINVFLVSRIYTCQSTKRLSL